MQPTGMSPQRCIVALRSLRDQLTVDPNVRVATEELFNRAGAGAPLSDMATLKDSLRLNIELRRERKATSGMSAIERDVYLPTIVGVLKLLEHALPFVAAQGRPFIEDAVALADRALQKATASDRHEWRASH